MCACARRTLCTSVSPSRTGRSQNPCKSIWSSIARSAPITPVICVLAPHSTASRGLGRLRASGGGQGHREPSVSVTLLLQHHHQVNSSASNKSIYICLVSKLHRRVQRWTTDLSLPSYTEEEDHPGFPGATQLQTPSTPGSGAADENIFTASQ